MSHNRSLFENISISSIKREAVGPRTGAWARGAEPAGEVALGARSLEAGRLGDRCGTGWRLTREAESFLAKVDKISSSIDSALIQNVIQNAIQARGMRLSYGADLQT